MGKYYETQDEMIIDEIIEDIEEGLKKNKVYIFVLNIPRLKKSLNNHLKERGYDFIIEDNTTFDGNYSGAQTRYTINP